ncbi:lysM and putative peptidoglycan-binding domain-containing protein 1 [Vidua chalybeata]|uniref:lysM and putative peptidoglycan-binding domain-containing protein 1 n=1 Tax=Vidua chalybeata TaxID=81927 RepID=UPI0023A888CA|nr:lysM and putative peptidoglycan-binding domain-containing protein 1 [Vidua chalybeata]
MAGSGGAGAAPREHRLQPGDTLPGLALRYGVTMEQIQRANRLYSSDTIFLRATLLIPGHRDTPGDTAGDTAGDIPGDTAGDIPGDTPGNTPGNTPGDTPGDRPGPSRRDLSASDFLRRLDAEIGRSKEAAAQRLQGRSASPAPAAGGPGPASPRGARLGARPLTRTPRAAALRDAEDEIFTL